MAPQTPEKKKKKKKKSDIADAPGG